MSIDVDKLVKSQSWLRSVVRKLRWRPTAHREMSQYRDAIRQRKKLPTPKLVATVGPDGAVKSSGIVDGNHRLIAASELKGSAKVELSIEMGDDRVVKKIVTLPLKDLSPKYVGNAVPLAEATTNHDEKGRFCCLDTAKTVVKDGVHHRVVRSYEKKSGTKVRRHPRRKTVTPQRVMDHVERGRARVDARLRPNTLMRVSDLVVEADGGSTVEMDDQVLTQAARAVAKADPKSRFGEMGIRRWLAKQRGAEYVTLVAKGGGPYQIQREIRRLASGKNKVFIEDRARGYWRMAKSASGKGLEFKKEDRDTHEILYNGEMVGEIVRQWGLGRGSTRRSEHTFDVDIDREAVREVGGKSPSIGKSGFKNLREAKAWAKAELKRAGL